MKSLFFVFLFISLCSCSEGNTSVEPLFLKLSVNPENSEKIFLYDFADQLSVVTLDTNDSVLISSIYNILPAQNKIFILDRRGGTVFIYSDTGEIQKVIHNRGNGPEEYAKASCIAINNYANELYLVDNQLKKRFAYTINGDWSRVDTIPYRLDDILFLEEKREVWARNTVDRNDGYMMNCYQNEKLTAQFHPYHYMNGATVDYWENPLVRSGRYLYAHIMYNDTIYKYDFNQSMGGYVIDFGDYAIPFDIRNLPQDVRSDKVNAHIKDKDDKVARSPYFYKENDECIWISYIYDKSNYFYVYDKKSNRSKSFYGPYIGDVCILNVSNGTFLRDNTLYFIIDPQKYQDLSADDKLEIRNNFEALYSALEKTSVDDNPVLLVAKIKNKSV